MWAEFKTFLLRGNVLELAAAFVLGVAFSAVVTTFADGLIMQPVADIFGFEGVGQMAFGPFLVGPFIAATLSFVVLAMVVFFLLRAAARFSPPPVDETPTPDSDEVVLLREIRDALRTPRP